MNTLLYNILNKINTNLNEPLNYLAAKFQLINSDYIHLCFTVNKNIYIFLGLVYLGILIDRRFP